MKEILITSSVLILAVILLRLLFRNKVSRRLIYGAWLLVALRLLIPVQFGNLNFSVLTPAKPVTNIITDIAQRPVSGPDREQVYSSVLQDYLSQGSSVFIPEVQEQVEAQIQHGRPEQEVYDELLESNKPESILLPEINREIESKVSETVTPTVGQIATVIWIAGMVAMAVWFVAVNLSFHRKLRVSAKAFDLPESEVSVKVSSVLTSPCLFGLWRPTIYMTPGCVDNEQTRRHVLTHELTHLHHGDHIWSWVRCLCLCIYWFNPLVWVAASLSRRDCELACDEAALKKLGEGERLTYGKTLIDMVSSVPAPGQLLETATAMHETKKQLKERMKCIVKKPKVFLTAAIILLVVLTVITGCTFSGALDGPNGTASGNTQPTTVPTTSTTTQPTTVPTTTTVPNSTTVPPTTGDQKPVEIAMEDLPVLPQGAVLPENPTLEDLLLEPYIGTARWYDMYDQEYSVTMELPLLVPFCDGAKAINESIRSMFQPKIDDVQLACEDGLGVFDKVVYYDAYLNGDVLSIVITGDSNLDHNYYNTYNLDISTGKELSRYDMVQQFAGVSYPEFLLHATYTVYNALDLQPSGLVNDFENDAISMSGYKLALDGSGELMMYGYLCSLMRSVALPYDPHACNQEYTDWERGAYEWVFQRQTDGAYAESFANLLADSFFLDTESFLRYLSEASDTVISNVASLAVYGLHPEELDDFQSLCGKYLEDNTTAKAARVMLTAVENRDDQEELEAFDELFSTEESSERNYYFWATGHTYSSPTQIILKKYFDGGFPGEPDKTDAEWEELSKLLNSPELIQNYDCIRLPKDRVNAELMKAFGITLEDLPDSAFEGLYYLESTDCYYFFQTGMTSIPKHSPILSIEHNDDGTVALTYNIPGGTGEITLKPNGDGYLVVSNIHDPAII